MQGLQENLPALLRKRSRANPELREYSGKKQTDGLTVLSHISRCLYGSQSITVCGPSVSDLVHLLLHMPRCPFAIKARFTISNALKTGGCGNVILSCHNMPKHNCFPFPCSASLNHVLHEQLDTFHIWSKNRQDGFLSLQCVDAASIWHPIKGWTETVQASKCGWNADGSAISPRSGTG